MDVNGVLVHDYQSSTPDSIAMGQARRFSLPTWQGDESKFTVTRGGKGRGLRENTVTILTISIIINAFRTMMSKSENTRAEKSILSFVFGHSWSFG